MMTQSTLEWSEALLAAFAHAHAAHARSGLSPKDAVRFHDRMTPYIVHPMWCAASLLQEPTLDRQLRQRGGIALLWHDTLEDTSLPLPADTEDAIEKLVHETSFSSFDEEREALWERTIEVKLLKLYDKVSNLLDGHWMNVDKWNAYVEHTLRLSSEVEQVYGNLNIVRMARIFAVSK